MRLGSTVVQDDRLFAVGRMLSEEGWEWELSSFDGSEWTAL